MIDTHLLSLIVFIPLLGAVALLGFGKGQAHGARGFALFVSSIVFLLSIILCLKFDNHQGTLQLIERMPWIPSIGAQYYLGVDGISLWLIVLAAFLTPIIIVSSYSSVEDKVREYLACMLALETAMMGALVSQDALLFYVFWEAMLIPMYFLIGIYGGKNKIYATVKFFIFTMVGSVLMLVALLYLHIAVKELSGPTFEIAHLTQAHHHIPLEIQKWLFLAFAVAFAIKVPMFPLHTWLPDAHVEAPTGGSIILAGVLLKMGTYGFIRFAFPLFPTASRPFLVWVAALAVIGIIYGALVSMVQTDMKKVVAYSSVSHLGFVMLGLAAMNTVSVTGAVYQMLNHGISTGALFLLVSVIYERRHTRMIKDFGGLAHVMPLYSVMFLIIGLSSIGLPGLNGFVGEFMILAGAAKSSFIQGRFFVPFAALGVIIASIYILWMYQRVFFGEIVHSVNRSLKDLNLREAALLTIFVLLTIVMGLFPRFFLQSIEPSVRHFVDDYRQSVQVLANTKVEL